jgi:hypothetical protein
MRDSSHKRVAESAFTADYDSMKKRLLFGLPLLAALSLFAAACGGDDDDASSGDKTEATKSAGGTTGGDKASATADATSSGDGKLTGNGADELEKLTKDLKGKTFLVTYDMEVTDADKKTSKGSLTSAQKDKKTYTKFDIAEGATDDLPGNFAVIDNGEFSFICSDSGGEKSCLKSKSTGEDSGFTFSADSLVGDLDDDLKVEKHKDQKIAGADSKCFKLTDSTTSGLACFAKDTGIMTFIDGTDEDGMRFILKATKVSSSVPDGQFEPPKGYEVVDLGG